MPQGEWHAEGCLFQQLIKVYIFLADGSAEDL